MDDWLYNIENIASLSTTNKELSQVISPYLAKQIWSINDRRKLLDELATVFLRFPDDRNVINAALNLGPVMRDLLHRCYQKCEHESGEIIKNLGVLVGQLIRSNFPNYLQLIEVEYFVEHYFHARDDRVNSCPSKKPKVLTKTMLNVALSSVAQIVRNSAGNTAVRNWPWKKLFHQIFEAKDHLDRNGVIAVIEILSIVLQLPWNIVEDLRSTMINESSGLDFIAFENCSRQSDCLRSISEDRITVCDKGASYTKRALTPKDFTDRVVVAAGVMMHSPQQQPQSRAESTPSIVITDTVRRCLHSLAIGAANSHPMIVTGSPGCGKTTLIRHFAKNIVRKKLIEVQLGDGVDSKVLSGVYKCTAVSGEFEWQPGVLAQAINNGDWILMEDIDKAPLDVISLLLPLLENKSMGITGQSITSDNAGCRSEFRIFMTCRTSDDCSALNMRIGKLKRHSRCVELDELSECDLKSIVESKYPKLAAISEKILEIYENLAHMEFESSSFDAKSCKRVSSVRDLLRFCSRIPSRMTKDGCELAQAVAFEAVDSLVASVISYDERCQKVRSIFGMLNLAGSQAEYYCQSYQPQIVFHDECVNLGRATLQKNTNVSIRVGDSTQLFALTRSSSVLLERVSVAVEMNEPVLLVGETGVGKTTGVQYLADKLGRALHIINISQQSSSSDLLGAFKPIQRKHLITPVRDKFEKLFVQTFSKQQNDKFLSHIQSCYLNKRYNDLIRLLVHGTNQALKKKSLDERLSREWQGMRDIIGDLKVQMKAQESVAFTFVEGTLSQALRNGDWLLLDEINLASPETLDCLSSVLESAEGSVALLEIGDTKPITRHPDFRIFAAMNPATDVGKRNLPNNIRSRFLEIYVAEPADDSDLLTIIGQYLKGRTICDKSLVNGVLKFYRQICKHSFAESSPQSSSKPVYSLRSLCRALRYVSDNRKMNLIQALFEGLCLAFLTEVDHTRHEAITDLIVKHLVGQGKKISNRRLPKPIEKHVTVEGYHVVCGREEPCEDKRYIMTPHIQKNLKVLARAVSYGKYPVLIQGETSTGKTSMINYLASLTGNKVFRINNHEHTDLQEYIGSYSSGADGQFYFQEGPLVTAMREGHWIILDELNLAPTDILESLNRVLDDNRELFIPETQERVAAHPRFALFATQNPPGMYGGRKVLSRALKNRFIELHFGQIPSDEIKTILHLRCDLPMSRCKKLISVMEDLQEKRSASGIFAGKLSYITLRDLFRWAERYRRSSSSTDTHSTFDWDDQLANDGYMLLAGKVRTVNEEDVIKESIEKHLNRKIVPDKIFGQEAVDKIIGGPLPTGFEHIVFTAPLRKLIVMLHRALTFDEPVLLVGDTGCGKTTACQLLSAVNIEWGSALNVINCHSHSDASDFLGGLRPVRQSALADGENENCKLFEWVDGPLVCAMLNGNGILVDEISLAEDSVLERLNSVLEPERKLVIPDRVESNDQESDLTIQARSGFQFMATMNPGGDFGKKELSPALRNRLTEIWCTAVNENLNEVTDIAKHNLQVPAHLVSPFAEVIVKFVKWFTRTTFGSKVPRSIRDIMKWIRFCNGCCRNGMDPVLGIMHGALLVFVDGIGSGISDVIASQSKEARVACIAFILKSLKDHELDSETVSNAEKFFLDVSTNTPNHKVSARDGQFVIGPFGIALGQNDLTSNYHYSFDAPSTSMNLFRLMRALQSSNPVLLEGSPGIGKTSLVVALARATGHGIVRINLSEQTDISDLLGADVPVEDGVGGQFSWRDGPLLTALKNSDWVVFDELNLASQSVLEGLNSVFDHRNEIFVPELGVTFNVKCDETRIFACQNPYYQGGGRKGLPKSFLNRFNQVYMEPLSETDMVMILRSQFELISVETLAMMVRFNEEVKSQVIEKHLWGHAGSPWEFNLRDLTRWCRLVAADHGCLPQKHMYLIYCERLQKYDDRLKMFDLSRDVFGNVHPYVPTSEFHISTKSVMVGNAVMQRRTVYPEPSSNTLLLPSMLHSMESLMTVLQQGWMAILTGASGRGKTVLMKTLAALTGNKLRVFAVNSCMDATELLGGFEQLDFLRHLKSIPDGLTHEIHRYCGTTDKLLSDGHMNWTVELLGSIEDVNELKSKVCNCSDVSSALNCGRKFQSLLKNMLTKCSTGTLPNALMQTVQKYEVKLRNVLQKIERSRGKFEWVDSELVEALKSGDWLLIEGANLCNPSVLDRLNALLEPGGTLTVTERGVIDGSFVEIVPHPSFRIVLSLDASEGNLSRAMRNRGVEVHLLSPEHCDGIDSVMRHGTLSWDEVEKLLQCRLSYCPASVGDKICRFLMRLFRSGKMKSGNPQSVMFDCLRCAQEISEAVAVGDGINESVITVCSRYSDEENIRDLMRDFDNVSEMQLLGCNAPTVRLNNIIHDTDTAMIFHQGQIFSHISVQSNADLRYEAVCYFLRLASVVDWETRIKYLKNFVINDSSMLDIFERGVKAVLTCTQFEKMLATNGETATMSWDLALQTQMIESMKVCLPDSVHGHVNACTLLFVTKLQHLQLEKELLGKANAPNRQKSVGKRKQKRKRVTERNDAKSYGPLVASYLYHNGAVKSQNLQDPSFMYLFPLYEEIFSFIYHCVDVGDRLCPLVLVLTLEKVLEMCYLWRGMLEANESIGDRVMMSVRKMEKCVEVISKDPIWRSDVLASSHRKLEKVFRILNQSYSTDWSTLSIQNELRLLHGQFTLGASPFKCKEQHVFAVRLGDLLQRIVITCHNNPGLLLKTQTRDAVHEICRLFALRVGDVPCASEVDGLESSFNMSVDAMNATNNESDNPRGSDSSGVIALDFKSQRREFVSEMMQHSLLKTVLELLMFCDKDEISNWIGVLGDEILPEISSQSIMNARLLRQLSMLRATYNQGTQNDATYITNHVMSVAIVLLQESNLSEIYCHSSDDRAGSVLAKPSRSSACFKVMHSKIGVLKPAKNTAPLENISAGALKIWTEVCLPLCDYDAKMDLLKSMKLNLWTDSFQVFSSSGLTCDKNILYCCCMYLSYLTGTLSLFAAVPGLSDALFDTELRDTLELLADMIIRLRTTSFFQPELLDSLDCVCKELRPANFVKDSESVWLAEIQMSLKNALRCVLTLGTKLQSINCYDCDIKQKRSQIACLLCLGVSWVWTSAVNYQLVSPWNEIDPVRFHDFTCENLEHNMKKHENQFDAYAIYVAALTGHKLIKDVEDLYDRMYVHRMMPFHCYEILKIRRELALIKEANAYRPDGDNFKRLAATCKQTFSNFLSVSGASKMLDNVQWVMQQLDDGQRDIENGKLEIALSKVCGVQSSLRAFVKTLSKFTAFPDFCAPLRESANHFMTACGLIENALKPCFTLALENAQGITLESFFKSLMSIEDRRSTIPNLKSMSECIGKLLENDDSGFPNKAPQKLAESLLIALLLRLRNNVLFEGVSSTCVQDLKKLMDYVVAELDLQQKRETEKAEEKASLYKTKHHLQDLSEEQAESDQFCAIFGYNPEKGSSENTSADTLESEKEVQLSDIASVSKYSDALGKVLMEVHKDITGLARKTVNSKGSKSLHLERDVALPCMYASSKMHSLFHSQYDRILNIGVDDSLLNANLASIHQCVRTFEGDFGNLQDSCNIYRDPLISEAKCCLPILDRLVTHIKAALLSQWPDHPVLQKIVEVCERIKGFSVSSPLIVFVSGMELLYGSMQEWEKNACSSVSLQEFMCEVANVIFKWRKMELSNWSCLIEDEYKRLSSVKPSLYRTLYQLIDSEFDESNTKDLVTHLESFMESSTLPQFCHRLDVLSAFIGHASIFGGCGKAVSTCLENVHSYYAQFKDLVTERLEILRKPIEKELRDFVAITKWNDRTFFAMQSSVEKAHRHLFNYVRKFSLAMQEKVQVNVLVQGTKSTCFFIPPDNAATENGFTRALDLTALKDACALLAEQSLTAEDFPTLSRLEKLSCKLEKICAYDHGQILDSCIDPVEDSIAEIIDMAQQLRDAKPKVSADKKDEALKAKRISEAKNIKLRKQKALTDLFKYLSEIGLSYKKGLMANKQLSAETMLMTERPESASAVKASVVPGGVEVDRVLGRTRGRDYFFEIILKWSCLSLAAGVPHKDMTKSALDRCLGFIGDLMKSSISQRKVLCATVQSASNIDRSLAALGKLSRSNVQRDVQSASCYLKDSAEIVNMSCSLLEEIRVWLDCCPSENQNASFFNECTANDGDLKTKNMRHGGEVWSNILDHLSKLSMEAFRLKNLLDNLVRSHNEISVYTESEVLEIDNLLTSFQDNFERFATVSRQDIRESPTPIKTAPMVICRCADLLQTMKINSRKYRCLFENADFCSSRDPGFEVQLLQMTESVTSKLLVSVQEFKKAQGALDETERLKATYDLIDVEIRKLSPATICTAVFSLTELIARNLCRTSAEFARRVATTVLTLASEYQTLLRRLEAALRKVNRTTMKLCYVTGGIFLQLCKNGYCTPDDVKEEVDEGEGAELEDAEGGGVGEGEGSNDVSDQIEDQEMLEDKPGEEGDDDDDGDKNIEASENAVEMDRDFEGKFDENEAAEEKNEDESGDEEEPDLEKQMGDLGDMENRDKLDEKFWGSDEESDQDDDENDDGKNENGPGEEEKKNELAAKDDATDDEDKREDDRDQRQDDDNDKPNDESEYNPAENDPYAENDNNSKSKEEELMDIPDDLNVDDEQAEDETRETEEASAPADDDEEEVTDGNMDVQERADEEQVEDNEDNAEDNVDMDTQEPLPADETSNKDDDNTVADVQSKDQNRRDEARDNSSSLEQVENNAPPPDDNNDTGNEGQAPANDVDETAAQYSRVEREDKDRDDSLPAKKQNSRRADRQDPNETKDSSVDERLNIVDPMNRGHEDNDCADEKEPVESDAYQHVDSPADKHDRRVFDSADQEMDQIDTDTAVDKPVDDIRLEETMDVDETDRQEEERERDECRNQNLDLSQSEIHVNMSNTALFKKYTRHSEEEAARLRKMLEDRLRSWRNDMHSVSMRDAEIAWDKYCQLTRPLSIELCEQLRLVLEPTQASQLRGDYRTGKRLNIRKMIPYIASGYRKDKIWLRRTKPSKRTYQVMLAVDDSSSMVDNHTKQLAFESVAVISGAMSSLEVGEFAVCSFGEDVQLLQNFGETFTAKSGASFLKRCTFSQKKTKIARFLDYGTALFRSASRLGPSSSNDVSQLLLIISDGRGLYLEGRKRVLESVNAIHNAGVFVAFVILDQPNDGEGSISDIKVPVFGKPGEMPEIRSYMKDFPFPFYAILRNINVLPQTLGEALRQWFILVSGSD